MPLYPYIKSSFYLGIEGHIGIQALILCCCFLFLRARTLARACGSTLSSRLSHTIGKCGLGHAYEEGAMFDSQLIIAPHVKSLVKKSSFHLRNIGKARRVLTEDATKTVMQSLVMSRLDYCNALLIGIQQDLIAKLQRLQNSAARIVSRTSKYEHITPVLIKLHWLHIKFRIQFKVLLLVYKALNGLAPKYIKELLVPYKPRRHLRSEASKGPSG